MRSRKVLMGLACVAASTMCFSTAHADRRTGLSGNLLIQDPDDLFPFPQYTLTHRNMLRLDYGPGGGPNAAVGGSGNGIITLGNEDMGIGIAVHRGDLLSMDVVGQSQELVWLSGVGDPFGGIDDTNNDAFPGPNGPVLPATVLDLTYGRRMGDNLLGARLGFGRGVESVDVDGDVQKGAQTFFAVGFGYSLLPPDAFNLDLSANVVFALGNSTQGAPNQGDDLNSGTNIRVGVLARGYFPVNDIVDVGFLANVNVENENVKNDPSDTTSNAFDAGVMAGVGPAINLDRAKVAMYGGLAVGFGTNEPNDDVDDDETGRLSLAAPMVNMAAEVQLLDWMFVRTGAQYIWNLERRKTTPGGTDVVTKETDGIFGWTAGLGVQKDQFSFDGVVTNGFVTGGPNFIGGTAPGFLAMASITYKFGDVFSGEGTAPQETTTPSTSARSAPEPEPTYRPESDAPAYESGLTGDADATGDVEAGDGRVEAEGSAGFGIGN